MQTYISILRGINVSGQKLIKMADLLDLYNKLGYKNAKNYIQSGNVVFKSSKKNPTALEKEIKEGVKSVFGFDVPVMVKEKKEVAAILKNNPFLQRKQIDLSKLHVTFLSGIPDPLLLAKIETLKFGDDEFVTIGDVVYLHCPVSYGNTKLSNIFFENKLKLTATTRNWKTINELFSLAENCD